MTIYTQIASMPTIFCAVSDAGLVRHRTRGDRYAMCSGGIVGVKTSLADDVYFVVNFRQGQVAIDRGQVDGVGQAICLC
jgi:hypothetical protein